MTPRALVLSLAAAVALAAGAAQAAEPIPCTGTLSGAATGTFKCGLVVRDLGDGTAVLEIVHKEKTEGVRAFTPGGWIIPGTPAKRTYAFADLGQGRSSLILEADGTLFSAQRTSAERGDVTLVLTNAKAAPKAPGTWEVSGSFKATLLAAASRRTDAVTVEVKF